MWNASFHTNRTGYVVFALELAAALGMATAGSRMLTEPRSRESAGG
ncbi:hypothetical protein [Microbacterium alcoholitolerans]